MKSYYFEEGIISEKMGCGAECTSSVIKNLNGADYIIKKAFEEINRHDKLSKVSFVSCSNKVAEIQCMYDNYIQSRDLYYEYGNKVDKKFTKEQEKVCDSLGDLNINKITVGDNLGVYDYQRPGSIKTLNLSVLLSYGDIDKALREDYEKQVKNIEYLRELVKLDDNQWPPEYTTEQVKAIKDYVKYLDDNEIKFDTYEKERQKFLESDDLNFITKGEERLSLILDFIPGVGLIKGGYETIVGVDPITKRKLSGVERAISGFACLLDAKGLYKIGKTAFKVSVKDGAKFGSKYLAKEFAKDTIGGYGFYAATQAADKAGIGPKGQLAIIGGLLAYGNRKNIAGAVSKADAKLKGVHKGSFLDEMRLTNKSEYKRLMANLSDVTKDKKVYMSCFGAGTFEQIYKSNKNLREVTKILDNCKFTDLEKAEIHKLLSSGDKAEISKFSKVCASSAGDSKKIKEYLNNKVKSAKKVTSSSLRNEFRKGIKVDTKHVSDIKNESKNIIDTVENSKPSGKFEDFGESQKPSEDLFKNAKNEYKHNKKEIINEFVYNHNLGNDINEVEDSLSKVPSIRDNYVNKIKELALSNKSEVQIKKELEKYKSIIEEVPFMSTSEIARLNNTNTKKDIDKTLQTIESILKGRSNSDILRSNLKKSGISTPKYCNNAHHIVPVNDDTKSKVVSKCRKILSDFGIDINSADNGVFLPVEDLEGLNKPINHRKIHTNKYYENLYIELKKCKTKESLIETLHDIRDKILTGEFKY